VSPEKSQAPPPPSKCRQLALADQARSALAQTAFPKGELLSLKESTELCKSSTSTGGMHN